MSSSTKFVVIILIGLLGIGLWSTAKSSDCYKVKFNGQIICKCDYPNEADWKKVKEGLGGEGQLEPVTFDEGKDPCKGK